MRATTLGAQLSMLLMLHHQLCFRALLPDRWDTITLAAPPQVEASQSNIFMKTNTLMCRWAEWDLDHDSGPHVTGGDSAPF